MRAWRSTVVSRPPPHLPAHPLRSCGNVCAATSGPWGSLWSNAYCTVGICRTYPVPAQGETAVHACRPEGRARDSASHRTPAAPAVPCCRRHVPDAGGLQLDRRYRHHRPTVVRAHHRPVLPALPGYCHVRGVHAGRGRCQRVLGHQPRVHPEDRPHRHHRHSKRHGHRLPCATVPRRWEGRRRLPTPAGAVRRCQIAPWLRRLCSAVRTRVRRACEHSAGGLCCETLHVSGHAGKLPRVLRRSRSRPWHPHAQLQAR